MTQEQKDLLLKDLCTRLPYKTLINIDGNKYRMEEIRHALIGIDTYKTTVDDCNIEQVKPYLFPMSSMTEEQEAEWYDRYITPLCERMKPHTRKEDLMLSAKTHYVSIFWLLENHFDYLGLIEKGLAIDATNLGIYK